MNTLGLFKHLPPSKQYLHMKRLTSSPQCMTLASDLFRFKEIAKLQSRVLDGTGCVIALSERVVQHFSES